MDWLIKCCFFFAAFFAVPLPQAVYKRFIAKVAVETTSGPVEAFTFELISISSKALYATVYFFGALILLHFLGKKSLTRKSSFVIGVISSIVFYYLIRYITSASITIVLIPILTGAIFVEVVFRRLIFRNRTYYSKNGAHVTRKR